MAHLLKLLSQSIWSASGYLQTIDDFQKYRPENGENGVPVARAMLPAYKWDRKCGVVSLSLTVRAKSPRSGDPAPGKMHASQFAGGEDKLTR